MIVVTGGRGQLGRALARRSTAQGVPVVALGRAECDVTDEASVRRALDAHAPSSVIDAAAYTAVDRAEAEPDRAFAVNTEGAAVLARCCEARRVRLLYVSTDYVFGGAAREPYREDDPLAPLGAYGESKAAGERAVHAVGGTVVRTSWLFGEGGPSFVHTILRLAKERSVLRVVADQRGCPTWADDLADALLALAARTEVAPTYHVCNAGETTWHGFAQAIVAEARRHRSLACERVEAITTAEYPTPARRPAYSVLDTARIRALGIGTPPWQPGLASVVAKELA